MTLPYKRSPDVDGTSYSDIRFISLLHQLREWLQFSRSPHSPIWWWSSSHYEGIPLCRKRSEGKVKGLFQVNLAPFKLRDSLPRSLIDHFCSHLIVKISVLQQYLAMGKDGGNSSRDFLTLNDINQDLLKRKRVGKDVWTNNQLSQTHRIFISCL